MELNQWAKLILEAETLEGKLFEPDCLSDESQGSALFWKEPARPPGMGFSKRTKEEKLPPFQEHGDPDKRAICLHRFAGHELLAVEMMAYTLLAFPDAPKTFRKGLAHTLKEEQGHVRLYMEQMQRFGIKFGDYPLYRHFWRHTEQIHSPLHYISLMSLTFEMANLDFASMYGKSFALAGDEQAAALMARILQDEISHVRFGWQWLKRLKKRDQSEWDAWQQTLATTRMIPKRAKGFVVHEAPRLQAGVSQEWIEQLIMI